jgi:hypothetical protein
MKIAFYTPAIDIRGSCNALYYYAHYNETILGNTSVIVTSFDSSKELIALNMFSNRFKILYYDKNIDDVLDDYDILYCIKHGLLRVDSTVSHKIKTVVHCVFDMTEKHGDVFAGVSKTLASKFGYNKFVPHMIGLEPSLFQDNLRELLCIPNNAVVFGRYGGLDTFDLSFARTAISRAVRANSNLWFLFINTPLFDTHPQIIHLNPIIENNDKNKFICTCDAHLECGSLGHTFGIAMGEFSVNNKPIICYDGPMWNTAHLDILGVNGIYFRDENSLYTILTTFDPLSYKNLDNNHYKNYNPNNIMDIFKKVFIDEESL